METHRERLERKLEEYRQLLLEFRDGPTHALVLDLIEEVEEQLRDLDKLE
jgi:hypothetical protein